MILPGALVKKVSAAVQKGVSEMSEELLNDFAWEQEPALMARLNSKIVEKIKSIEAEPYGFQLDAFSHNVPDLGRGSLDSELGADAIHVVEIQGSAGNLLESKMVLIQAKKGMWTDYSTDVDLKDQCKKMLRVTPASVVAFVQPDKKVLITSAMNAIVHIGGLEVHADPIPLLTFYSSLFLSCWVGDDLDVVHDRVQALDLEKLKIVFKRISSGMAQRRTTRRRAL